MPKAKTIEEFYTRLEALTNEYHFWIGDLNPQRKSYLVYFRHNPNNINDGRAWVNSRAIEQLLLNDLGGSYAVSPEPDPQSGCLRGEILLPYAVRKEME